jgi:6-phosphofructokinase 1
MKVAVLTGGGDCPGLNAVIRAVVRRASEHGFEMMGLRDGWKGLLEDNHFRLTRETTSGILHRGGTILGTSRVNPFKVENGLERVKRAVERNGIHAIIAIGGEGTLSAATRMSQEGLRIVGVPKTIDNDINSTDFTFGFDTAITIATEAIDRLHSTAESHKRVIVCEVMGRHVGWIATYAGIAGGADVILVPEIPADLPRVAEHIRSRHATGRNFSIVVVAEGTRIKTSPDQDEQLVTSGALDEAGRPRLGGVGNIVAAEIERRTGFETRVSVLGHIQRGGAPTAHDRVLATRYGVHACDMVARGEFGKMAALRGNDIVTVDLADATRELKRVPEEFFKVAQVFFG